MSTDQKPSIDHMRTWVRAQADRGVYKLVTVKAKLTGLEGMLSVLGDDEPKDDPKWVIENLSDIARRYAIKNNAKTETTNEYASRAKLLIEEYLRYMADPKAFKPKSPPVASTSDGESKPKKVKAKAKNDDAEEEENDQVPQSKTGLGRFHSYPLKGGRVIEYRTDAGTEGKAPLMMDDIMRFTIALVSQAEDFDLTNPDHQAILGLAKRITTANRQLGLGE